MQAFPAYLGGIERLRCAPDCEPVSSVILIHPSSALGVGPIYSHLRGVAFVPIISPGSASTSKSLLRVLSLHSRKLTWKWRMAPWKAIFHYKQWFYTSMSVFGSVTSRAQIRLCPVSITSFKDSTSQPFNHRSLASLVPSGNLWEQSTFPTAFGPHPNISSNH